MSGWSLKGKKGLNALDPSKELVPLRIGRTERRREESREKQEAEKERKGKKEEVEEERETQKKRKKERKRQATNGGSFCREKHQRSNASLPLISVKKIEQSEHFFFLLEQRRQYRLKLKLFTRQTKSHVNKTISAPTPSLAPHCGST